MNPLYDHLKPLEQLQADTQPKWGIMTAQHMVEHLSATMRISNGKLYLDLRIPEEKIPARMTFLYSNEPFAKNVRVMDGPAVLRPLVTNNLAESLTLLKKMIDVFDQHYVAQPDDCPIHPLFGPLNRDQWIHFHKRHMTHHFTQFGLL
ncbi:MAG: DUF1569 domain-containing protein [Bacteroidia bacterium]